MYSLRIQQNSYKTSNDHQVKGFWDVDPFMVSASKAEDNSTIRLSYGNGPTPTLQQDVTLNLKYNKDYYLVCHNDLIKAFDSLGLLMEYVVPLFEKAASVARYNYKPSDARDVLETLDTLSGRLGNLGDGEEGEVIGLHNNHFGDLVICSLGSRKKRGAF